MGYKTTRAQIKAASENYLPDLRDFACLKSAKRADDTGATWLPEEGRYARARKLATHGYLRKAGVSVMPPFARYVLADKGFMALSRLGKIDS